MLEDSQCSVPLRFTYKSYSREWALAQQWLIKVAIAVRGASQAAWLVVAQCGQPLTCLKLSAAFFIALVQLAIEPR